MKRVIRKNGMLTLQVNGRDLVTAAYMSYCPENADYDGFRKIGYNLFSYCVYAGSQPINEENGSRCAFEPGCWIEEDRFDFSPLDRGMARIAGEDFSGDCFVILRINLNMPAWWREKYPEELMWYRGGRRLMQSIASERWRKDACVFLRKLREHIAQSGYDQKVIGWQVAAMQTEEWIHPARFLAEQERDEPCLKGFRQRSSGDISLLTAEEILQKQVLGSNAPSWSRVRDFYVYLNETYADTIAFFAREVKRLHDGDIFVGAFTGYIGQLDEKMGHNTLSRLLDEPDIDFFASPFAYVDGRAMGVDWIYHAPMQSVDRAGKLWFLEADVRTCLTRHLSETRPDVCPPELEYFNQSVFFGPDSEVQSANNILRSFAKIFISRNAFWWFDMWGGWYKSEKLMALHARLAEIYRDGMEEQVESAAEIAVVLDENAAYGASAEVWSKGVYQQLVELGDLGAPYELLLLDRVDDADIDRYKLFLLACPEQSSGAYRSCAERIRRAGKAMLATGAENPMFDRAVLREQAEAAGVFVYSFGNIVYANEKYISVTATAEGEVCLKTQAALLDLLSGERLVPGNGEIRWQAEFNDCRLFRIVK